MSPLSRNRIIIMHWSSGTGELVTTFTDLSLLLSSLLLLSSSSRNGPEATLQGSPLIWSTVISLLGPEQGGKRSQQGAEGEWPAWVHMVTLKIAWDTICKIFNDYKLVLLNRSRYLLLVFLLHISLEKLEQKLNLGSGINRVRKVLLLLDSSYRPAQKWWWCYFKAQNKILVT